MEIWHKCNFTPPPSPAEKSIGSFLVHTNCYSFQCMAIRDGGLEDRPRSRGRPRHLILMASVSVLVSAAHVSVSVLVSEVPALSTGSREPASVSRPASRPNLDGLVLGLGLGHPCLGLGLGGPSFVHNPGTYLYLYGNPVFCQSVPGKLLGLHWL